MRSPLLFLVFNRPEATRRVFEAIRSARPAKLYIAADGPRAARKGESELCREVRDVVKNVDWPCEVRTLFRDQNLGCKRGVSGAINWFFDNEEEGIILEDDILPIPTFFSYCDEMLELYRNDERVAMVAGCNLAARDFIAKESYFFSNYCNVWGWATWRRVWRHYDVSMSQWPQWRDSGGLSRVSGGRFFFQSYWRRVLDSVYEGKVDAWGYQMLFTGWRVGLTILPAYSQIHNLGFGADATHTITRPPRYLTDAVVQALSWPLHHPQVVSPALKADAAIGSKVYGINLMTGLMQRVREMFR